MTLSRTWPSRGKSETFRLRDNVKSHGDYGTLTAQDVVDSFKRIQNPDTKSRFRGEQNIGSDSKNLVGWGLAEIGA